jgi:hypothetical protein
MTTDHLLAGVRGGIERAAADGASEQLKRLLEAVVERILVIRGTRGTAERDRSRRRLMPSHDGQASEREPMTTGTCWRRVDVRAQSTEHVR